LRGSGAAGELRAAEAVHPVRGGVQHHRAAFGEPAAALDRRRAADRGDAGGPDGRRGHLDLAVRAGRGGSAVAGPASVVVASLKDHGDSDGTVGKSVVIVMSLLGPW